MIDVEALIRQIIPGIIWPHHSGNRLEDRLGHGACGIERTVRTYRPGSSPRLDQEEK
jgi:hypothetical protein